MSRTLAPSRPLSAPEKALVNQWLPLAYKVAGQIVRRAPPPFREDIEQSAVMGLMVAAQHFDPTRGVAFSTYAWPIILQHARESSRTASNASYVPRVGGEKASRDGYRYRDLRSDQDVYGEDFRALRTEPAPVEDLVDAQKLRSRVFDAVWRQLVVDRPRIDRARTYADVFVRVRVDGQTLESVAGVVRVSKQRVQQMVDVAAESFEKWAATVRGEADGRVQEAA